VNPVHISRGAAEEISAHAREALPSECCGVLIGSGSAIVEARRTRNLSESRTRFEIDPKGHIDARRDARRRGLDVVGFYHSHPQSEPIPSKTDLAEASYPDLLHLIVRPLPERANLRLFRLDGPRYVELELVVGDGD
jgi:proteasome lid subunit RPN8/RPN11